MERLSGAEMLLTSQMLSESVLFLVLPQIRADMLVALYACTLPSAYSDVHVCLHLRS